MTMIKDGQPKNFLIYFLLPLVGMILQLIAILNGIKQNKCKKKNLEKNKIRWKYCFRELLIENKKKLSKIKANGSPTVINCFLCSETMSASRIMNFSRLEIVFCAARINYNVPLPDPSRPFFYSTLGSVGSTLIVSESKFIVTRL